MLILSPKDNLAFDAVYGRRIIVGFVHIQLVKSANPAYEVPEMYREVKLTESKSTFYMVDLGCFGVDELLSISNHDFDTMTAVPAQTQWMKC
jgi:hypothetical protein